MTLAEVVSVVSEAVRWVLVASVIMSMRVAVSSAAVAVSRVKGKRSAVDVAIVVALVVALVGGA